MKHYIRLIVFTLALNALVAVIAWTSLANSRDRQIHETANVAQDLSRLLVSEMESEFDKADMVVKTVRDELVLHRRINKAVRPEIEVVIKNQLTHNPSLTAVRVTDEHGESIYGFEGTKPPPNSNVSDRAYFAALRDDPAVGLAM